MGEPKPDKEKLDEQGRQILSQFDELGRESLDLHALFEAAGSDTEAREQVLDVVSGLVQAGYLEEHGSDFYALTPMGREALLSKGDN
ncbi:MAG TPA: hypothetical protein VKM94_01765 [Blastocatellia bacterium]|nr:hypothetical protein [Blastocatellia bacterium]